ncbi:ATP-grasp domain-containing protein [Jatrophihabitans fulvus]
MPDVVLATCADLPAGDEDAAELTAALVRRGVDVRWQVWTDPSARWDDATVVIRSTWDYHDDVERFLRWVGTLPSVCNSSDVIGWNTDKRYLDDLARAGVPTVPSRFAAPGQDVEVPDGEFVVKPSVGAGSRGAGRFGPGRRDDALAHAASLHEAGRTVLVQPFMTGVDAQGETALLYFDGRFSHAIRKGVMLPPDSSHPVSGGSLFVPENITAREPDPAQLEVGDAALAAVRDRFGDDQLYARVDLLPGPDGPVVTELELTEPSMFLGYADGAADRFAEAIAARA